MNVTLKLPRKLFSNVFYCIGQIVLLYPCSRPNIKLWKSTIKIDDILQTNIHVQLILTSYLCEHLFLGNNQQFKVLTQLSDTVPF